MRYLVITDIHANLPAFEAVLADAKDLYDKVWCLGDLVSVGSHPNECVELLLTLDHLCVAGADDWIVLGKDEGYENEILEQLNPHSRSSFLHTRELLTDRVRNYLDELPTKIIEDQFTLVHGSPRHPLWEYVGFPVVAQANFKYLETRYCLVGHNHAPLVFEEATEPEEMCQVFAPDPDTKKSTEIFRLDAQRLIINPGAIGGGTACHLNFNYSFYGILDTETSKFEFRNLPLKTNPFLELRRKRSSEGSTVKQDTEIQPSSESKLKQTIDKKESITVHTIDIYRNDEKIETKNFGRHFYIIKDSEGIYWETDGEQYKKTDLARKDKNLAKNIRRGGSIQIWIRAGGVLGPSDIHTVLPDWRVVLDNQLMEQGVYINLNITGKKVELLYNDYRFVCTFPRFEGDPTLIEKPYEIFSPRHK